MSRPALHALTLALFAGMLLDQCHSKGGGDGMQLTGEGMQKREVQALLPLYPARRAPYTSHRLQSRMLVWALSLRRRSPKDSQLDRLKLYTT